MFKLFICAFFIQSLFCYSQIDQKELDKLPPEVREKVLQALEEAKKKAQDKGLREVEEDVKKLKKERLNEENQKEGEKSPKLPLKDTLSAEDKASALKFIKELGANHYKVRKEAKLKLSKMGYKAIPLLKETLKSTEDPEVSENLKEIIAKLSHRLHIGQLTEQQRKIAKLSFKYGAVANPKVTGEFYNKHGHFIIDIGLTRMVFEGTIDQISNSYRRTVNITLDGRSGGGGSSSSNGFKIYKYSYNDGIGYWTICGHSFIVSNYELEVKKKKLKLKNQHPQIIFFDKETKPIGILDLK